MGNKKRYYTIFFIFYTTVVFSYVLIRASQFSFSEDEAFSLLDVLYMNPGYFFGNIANTHLLNSAFLWVETNCFGFQEVMLRMHSVFSFLIFAWVLYRFSAHFKQYSSRVLFTVVITLHPFMLDYFSMARGYSMSVAFMMLSLYFLYEGILPQTENFRKKVYIASFWSALSVVSCYVMFTFYIAVLIFYAIYILLNKNKEQPFKTIVLKYWEEKFFWLAHFFFSLGIMYLVMKLKPSSLHEFWPYNSFWGDTIFSLIETLSKFPDLFVYLVFIVFVLLILLSLATSLVDFYQKRSLTANSLFAILFSIIALLLVVEYHAFQITYLSYRGAIFLYPLIILMIFRSLTGNFSIRFQYVGRGLLYLFSLGITVNFVCHFSFSNGIGIVSKTGFVQALQDLKKLRQEGKEVSLGVSRAFPATIYYYKLKYKLDWVKNIGLGYELEKNEYLFYDQEKIRTGKYDYFILEEPDIPVVSASQKIILMNKYPESGIVLAKTAE